MKALCLLLLCCPVAFGQKMHVKVLTHTVDDKNFMRLVPGIGLANATANAGTASGSSIYLPAHTQELTLAHIQMLLLLPDGRRVGVYCNDHTKGLAQQRIQVCKNPEVDEFEADFSGAKVKLTWGVGLDGKKKVSETYIVGPVYPAPAPAPKP